MSGYGAPPPYGVPPPMGMPAGGPPPSNNLVWAIISLLCCWPLGIPAIVFAAQVNSKWAMGDFVGAQDSARKAKQFAMWATIAGVAYGVVMIILAAMGAFAGSMSSGSTY